jgi:hypothetical protein
VTVKSENEQQSEKSINGIEEQLSKTKAEIIKVHIQVETGSALPPELRLDPRCRRKTAGLSCLEGPVYSELASLQ